MPTESTKAAVQQLRDAGFEQFAVHLRDMVLELESLGASCSIGFIEWRPELGAAQILTRIGDLKPCPQPVAAASDAARTSAPATRVRGTSPAPTASSKKPGSGPSEQKESGSYEF